MGYTWAQYASSVTGLALLAVAGVRWWRRTPPDAERTARLFDRRERLLWWSAAVVCAVVGACLGAITATEAAARFRAITWTGTGAGLVLALASVEVGADEPALAQTAALPSAWR